MAYLVLTVDEQDEVLTAFMLSQERDAFTHGVNQQRYTAMLTALPPSPFRDHVLRLLTQTNSRIEEVGAVITHTTPQMPTPARIASAITRLKAKGAI